MKFTTVSIKEIQADKTHRLDAKYWIKKNKKNKSSSSQAGGPAHQAPSGKINYFKKKMDKDLKR